MTKRKLIVGITFLAIFAMSVRISIDTDTWWHLRTGQWIVENQAVPQTDPFSHTRFGALWQFPGWIVQAPMYWIYQSFGPGGLNIWTALMVTLAFVFVWLTLDGGPLLRAYIIILATIASGVYWAARPYLVTFVLAAVFLWILEDYRWDRSSKAWMRILCLPLLMIIWVNSHGGFVVGFILWGLYAFNDLVGRIKQRSLLSDMQYVFRNPLAAIRNPANVLWWVAPALVLAVCLNPAGVVMMAYPIKTISINALQIFIQEWRSPNFHSFRVQPFAWLLLLTFGVVGISQRRLALTDFLLVTIFSLLGLLAGRNIALFSLAAPAVLARHAAIQLSTIDHKIGLRWFSDKPTSRANALLNLFILVTLTLLALLKTISVLPASVNEAVFIKKLPVNATSFLKTQYLPGRLFNSYNWGAYLIWALPEYPVFVDGRTDLYDNGVLSEWFQVMRVEPDWELILKKYHVNIILIESGSMLARILSYEPGWIKVYHDAQAVIFVREEPVSGQIPEKNLSIKSYRMPPVKSNGR